MALSGSRGGTPLSGLAGRKSSGSPEIIAINESLQKATLNMLDAKKDIRSVPLLDLKAQYAPLREKIREAIDRVAEAQHFILGPEVEALETQIAAYSQCEFGIGVSSGSDALLSPSWP